MKVGLWLMGRAAVGGIGSLWVEWATGAMLLDEEDDEENRCWRIQKSSWAEMFGSLGKVVPLGGLDSGSWVARLGLEGLPMEGQREYWWGKMWSTQKGSKQLVQ